MTLTETELMRSMIGELDRHTVLTLATVGKNGPHAVSLMYAHDGFDIYWLSDPKTRHSRQLAEDGRASVTIAAQHEAFETIRGLQMSGRGCRLSKAHEENAAFDLLSTRYPFLQRFAVGKLARHLGAAAVYRFRPTRSTFIDNSRGFGFKQTLDIPPASDQGDDP